MKAPLPLFLLFLSVSSVCAQASRWQWGVGTSVHLSPPASQAAQGAIPETTVRTGLSMLARYRLNRKANLEWGPFRNRHNLFLEAGLRTDVLAYAYAAGVNSATRGFFALEAPFHLMAVADVRHLPEWRKRRLHGYARLGGSVGAVLPQRIDKMVGVVNESTDIGGLRAALHLSSGLLRKTENGSAHAVGIFARFGLAPVVKGRLASSRIGPTLPFRSAGSLFGIEWSYFFGRPNNGVRRLPEEPVDMILCPRF